MAAGVDAKTVNSHLDELSIAFNEVAVGLRILGVEIHAVASNLRPPAVGLVPVEVAIVVPQVVTVVVVAVGVFHLAQAVAVLGAAAQAAVVVLQLAALRDGKGQHALAHVALRNAVVAVEELAQVLLAKVARVVYHNVENHLHAAGMCRIYQVLELHVVALQAAVHLAHVHGMVAMIVIARGILHHRSNPYRSKPQRLDVVEFLYQSLEVATPLGVLIGDIACLVSIPAIGVVATVAVIETRGHGKIDGLVAKVGPATHKGGRSNALQRRCKQHATAQYSCDNIMIIHDN